MPVIHPRDVSVSLTHPTPQTSGGRVERTVDLTIERTVDGLPLVQISMTPDQFASLMASRVTPMRSDVELRALPTVDQMAKTAARWWRPGDRVHPRSGGQVVTVAQVLPIAGSLFRQQFRADGDVAWRHSDEYQLDPPRPGEDSDTVRHAAKVADLWRADSDPIIHRLVEQIDALVAEVRTAAAQEDTDVAGRLVGEVTR
jgi:hypothetical protein